MTIVLVWDVSSFFPVDFSGTVRFVPEYRHPVSHLLSISLLVKYLVPYSVTKERITLSFFPYRKICRTPITPPPPLVVEKVNEGKSIEVLDRCSIVATHTPREKFRPDSGN